MTTIDISGFLEQIRLTSYPTRSIHMLKELPLDSISFDRSSPLQASGRDVDSIIDYHYHLRRLNRYVDSNIEWSFQLSDAAAHIGLSPSRLSHYFVDKTGIRYSEWVRAKRVQAAISVFSADDRASVLDVALAVGFANMRGLERAFKKATGLTPTEFRTSITPQILSHR